MLTNKNSRIGRLSFGVPCTLEKGLLPASTITSTTRRKKPTSSITTKRSQRSCNSVSPITNTTTKSTKDNTNFDNNKLTVGQKVSVTSLCAFGTIRYIGTTFFKSGLWVGVELDIAGSGKNDGSIKGTRYFDCPPETGLFILANKVTPLKESTSSRMIPNKAVSPKKNLTSTGQHNGTKTPPVNDTTTNKTTRKPLSPISTRQQKNTTQPSTTSPTKKKATTTPSSLASKTHRYQPHSTTLAPLLTATQKPTVSKSTKSPGSTPRASSTLRKTASPILATPTKSSPLSTSITIAHPRIKQQSSKSTRSTVTPTTKKRNSTPSAIRSEGPETLRRSKSTSTRQVVTQEELTKMHLLLEQSRQEKQRLSDEMNGKEAVWERLVTAKESYALQVQDMQVEISRLQDSLHISQQQSAHLESQLIQYKPIGTKRSLSQSSTIESMNGGALVTERQYTRRIEKLERLVQQWQQDAQDSHQRVQQQQRDHTAQMEQLRRDLVERDQATATMERNYESAKQASTESRRHYESTMDQWKLENDRVLANKDDEIIRLNQVIDELKACQFLPPPSPDHDEDLNVKNKPTMGQMHSSRRRLEQQLELTTQALDDMQQQQQATLTENDQLREQLAQMHAASQAADQQFQKLQHDLSNEINDKRQVMEERDVGLQNQLRMEDEHKDLIITNTRLEHQLGGLTERLGQLQNELGSVQEAYTTMEHQCGCLKDDSIDLEEQIQQTEGDSPLDRWKPQIERRQQKVDQADAPQQTKSSQRHRDMSRLESQMEKKELRILELEELYRAERDKTRRLEARAGKQRRRSQKSTIQPCSDVIMPVSPISDTASVCHPRFGYSTDNDQVDDSLYCEICEIYGHDVIGCNALNRMSFGEQTMVYCVNCDLFDTHSTIECPNQDETF